MATILFDLNQKMFTGEFMQLPFICEAESMTFSVHDAEEMIFAQTYYPDEGHKVVIYDLDKLLEAHIDGVCATFSFRLDGTVLRTVTVFVCRTAVTERAQTFCPDFFFTAAIGERDTAPGRHEMLTYYNDPVTPVRVECTYMGADGKVSVKNVSLPPASRGIAEINVSPDRFGDAAAGRLLSYIVRVGQRKAAYRVLPSAPEADPALIFRNAFGCWETIYLTGARQTAPAYTRSTALIEGESRVYDIAETMSYKAHTGPLRPGMVPVALDLARAKEVYLLTKDGGLGDALTVTDADVKHTNEDNAIPDFEITYRRSSRRSAMLAAPRPPRLFDDTFDDTHE